MRCSVDSNTLPLPVVPVLPSEQEQLALPGLPEAPAKAPRTTQAQRMERMAYTGPKERPRCETCLHCDVEILNPDSLSEFERRRCELGGFPVLRGGICRDWTATR